MISASRDCAACHPLQFHTLMLSRQCPAPPVKPLNYHIYMLCSTQLYNQVLLKNKMKANYGT